MLDWLNSLPHQIMYMVFYVSMLTRCARKASIMAVNLSPRYMEGHYSGHVNYVKKGCVRARAI